jgi:hypothetical protein
MAYVHEIKFFRKDGRKDGQLYAALFDNPPFFCEEFWIKNIPAEDLGISQLSPNLELETKYPVEVLGVEPFPASKPLFRFIDLAAKLAWERGTDLIRRQFS